MVSLRLLSAYHAIRVYQARTKRKKDPVEPVKPADPQSSFTNEFTSEFV